MYKLGLDHPKRFAGIVMYAPAIKDNRKNAPIGKKFARFIGCLFPSMKTIRKNNRTSFFIVS